MEYPAGAGPLTMAAMPPEEPVLEADQIQGNVIPGFMKPNMILCGLAIADVKSAKGWLQEISGAVTTLAGTLPSRQRVRELRTYRPLRAKSLGAIPDDVNDAWLNIGFTRTGMQKLLTGGNFESDLDRFEDDAFQYGLAMRSPLLGDPTDPAAEGNPANWKVGGPGKEIDLLLTIGADQAPEGERLLGQVLPDPAGAGLERVYEQSGAKLDEIGSEQFGFQDGVSQPGVRGRVPGTHEDFLTPRTIDAGEQPESWLYGLPGQFLTWPGDYVFGYPASGPDPLVPGPLSQVGPEAPPWSRNGSYLAFRRFRQDVAGFWAFVAAEAQALSTKPGFSGWDAEMLAAHLVGRWKSGAPLERSPAKDEPALGTDRLANNDFQFGAGSVSLGLAAGGKTNGFPMAGPDPLGLTCPLASHIRKVNARTSANDEGGVQATFQRRIMRRGLPWGPRLEDPDGPDPADGQRGLLFLSQQASLTRQFEFLVSRWMNSATNPRSPSGFDLLVGQDGRPGAGRARVATVFVDDFASAEVAAPADYVIPTGGAYLFTPSLAALTDVLAA
jgi:Dyp-type peroxidase family